MNDTKTTVPWTSSETPAVLTYFYPPPDAWAPRYQLQWDYQIEWPKAGRPTITLLRFRSYQQKTAEGKAELVEDITEDIPVNEGVMMALSQHAAWYLFSTCEIEGDWRLADKTLLEGCEEAAKKRFSLSAFRQMVQAASPCPSILKDGRSQ